MKIYIRKIFKHDITHEVSITKEIVEDFFDGKTNLSFTGGKSGFKGEVSINSVTDPRFGGTFKQILDNEGQVRIDDILVIYKNKKDYKIEIVNDKDERYNILCNLFHSANRHAILYGDEEVETNTIDTISITSRSKSTSVGMNKLFYGIPGCGKSYKIASMLEYKIEFQEEAKKNGITSKVDKDNIFRTTFYLDYSYSDFVGQIYPVVDEGGSISYSPVPGPFTKALTQAYTHPEEMIYLVIEEINRGNAAAIFGDLFQLLDRVKIEEDDKIVGESEYSITNEFIESYFKYVNTGKEHTDQDYVDYEIGKIKIPANMTLFSTMNTSDQNVFPLDTAFKRRWERERVVPDWNTASTARLCIPFTNITWQNFATTINTRMIQNSEDGIITQDKNMGPYFASESMLSKEEDRHIDNEANRDKLIKFMNNVIDYLFLDVTKFNHNVLFSSSETYESIYDSFASGFIGKVDLSTAKRFLELFAEKIDDDIDTGIISALESEG